MDASIRQMPRAVAWLRAVAASSLVLVGVACDYYDLPTQPDVGFLKVDVVTTGDDTDADGYAITLDGGRTTTIGTSSNTGSFYVASGTYTVTIANVAPNCTVEGTTARQAEVTRGQVVTVLFTISCVGTGVTIATATSGADIPDGFKVTVDAQAPLAMAVNGTRTVGRLWPGTHTVMLAVPEHCTVEDDNPLTVVVANRGYAAADFTVACSPVIRRAKIAYIANGAAVETITLDGSRIDRLGTSGYSVAWTRDGRQLVVSDAECGYEYYYYYDVIETCRGGNRLADPELGTISPLAGADYGLRPAWSPARDELAFDREISSVGGSRVSQLWVLEAGAAVGVGFLVEEARTMLAATWAPDGERIAFVCMPEQTNPDLCVINRDGSGYRRLTTSQGAELDPAWSPDGRTIAFTRLWLGGASNGDVAVLDLASGTITSLAPGSAPAWSPDGSRIVFAGAGGLFLMNADGSNLGRLTTGNHTAPAWRPIR